jgi:TRAP-type uncharacterized transport system fused permease subunit
VATTSDVVLLAATAVHAGFQVTVTALVYPALGRAQDWRDAHTAHRRAITPVVGVVYAALVLGAVWVVVDGDLRAGTLVALAGIVLSLGVTALVAAPLHGRLSRDRDGALWHRLRVADLVRTSARWSRWQEPSRPP